VIDTEKTQRVCGKLPYLLAIKFKGIASQIYAFEKGFVGKAVNEAVLLWVVVMGMDDYVHKALTIIEEKRFKHIEDPVRRREAIIQAAINEYIENHLYDSEF
jgi:hypothetical protein